MEQDPRGLTHDQVEAIRLGLRRRETSRDPANLRGLDRVEIEVVEGLSYVARNPHEPDGRMVVGEPIERGGTGRGASPLSHFLAGAAACLLNQFIRAAVTEDHPVRFTGARARAEFSRAPGGGFQRISCEVAAEGEMSEATARALVERAERLCYVHCTLARVVEMTTILQVNGRELARRVNGPADA